MTFNFLCRVLEKKENEYIIEVSSISIHALPTPEVAIKKKVISLLDLPVNQLIYVTDGLKEESTKTVYINDYLIATIPEKNNEPIEVSYTKELSDSIKAIITDSSKYPSDLL